MQNLLDIVGADMVAGI